MIKAKEGYYNEKNGEGMVAVDSAEWYLEAAINYTNNDASQNSTDITWKSASATITIDNDGNLDMLQLAEIYDELSMGMVNENEYISIADINIKDDGDKASSKTVVLTAATGLKGTPPPPIVGTVNFEDAWHWNGTGRDLETGQIYEPFYGSGYCDPPNNEIINNRAATDILMTHTNLYRGDFLPHPYYWTDVETFFVRPVADYPPPPPNEIWWNTDNEYQLLNSGNTEYPELVYRKVDPSFPCMSPEELDWYINHGVFILIERLKPEGKKFGSIITSYEYVLSNPEVQGDKNKLWHTMSISYGKVQHEFDIK